MKEKRHPFAVREKREMEEVNSEKTKKQMPQKK